MNSEVTAARVKQIISTIFEVPLEKVTLETTPADVEKWDSMGHLMLLLELEQEFDVQIAPEQAEQLTSVQAIVDIVDGKK